MLDSLASSAAAPALTLDGERGLRRGLRAPGVGVRPKWVWNFAVEQKNKVLCFNYLYAHRPLDCPQILRRRQN